MGVYVYRITNHTVKLSNGEKANVTECLGKGPHYGASDRDHAYWDRKISTGYKRSSKLKKEDRYTGYFAESDEDGANVYIGTPSTYADSTDYELLQDENGKRVTVVNPRKPRPQHLVDQGFYDE